jgi:hypothetical protein
MEDSVATAFEKNPLLAFSPLTHLQVAALLALGDEIKDLISASVTGTSTVDGTTLNQAYARLWLWVLGAYDVLRTMSQAKACFTDDVAAQLIEEKRYLARLRMPLSKQEFAGVKAPSGLAGLLCGVDTSAKDVSFTIGNEVYSANSVIARFAALISSIKLSDIKARHSDSYQ